MFTRSFFRKLAVLIVVLTLVVPALAVSAAPAPQPEQSEKGPVVAAGTVDPAAAYLAAKECQCEQAEAGRYTRVRHASHAKATPHALHLGAAANRYLAFKEYQSEWM